MQTPPYSPAGKYVCCYTELGLLLTYARVATVAFPGPSAETLESHQGSSHCVHAPNLWPGRMASTLPQIGPEPAVSRVCSAQTSTCTGGGTRVWPKSVTPPGGAIFVSASSSGGCKIELDHDTVAGLLKKLEASFVQHLVSSVTQFQRLFVLQARFFRLPTSHFVRRSPNPRSECSQRACRRYALLFCDRQH